jgi:uncharacterized membrane protein YfcA
MTLLNPIALLLAGLFLLIVVFTIVWWQSARAGRPVHRRPRLLTMLLGFVTLFFDTLGIGNFAPTTAIFKLTRMVRDELIPGTLNVSTTIPAAIEAFAFMTAIAVDPFTLALLVPIGTLGSWLGGRVVSQLPRRPIQIGMGIALMVGAVFMLLTTLRLIPGGGDAIGFSGGTLAVAAVVNFALGGLCALGIGSYAPSLLVFSLMGMNPRSAFPIMMGSAAYMLGAASLGFVRAGRYDGSVALGITLGGIPGVLLAAFVVKSLPLEAIRWLVIAVVLYASLSMLNAARSKSLDAQEDEEKLETVPVGL